MNGWLTMHLVGVLLFAGNIITAAYWKVRADLSNDRAHIHHTVRGVMLADYVFTLPGLALIIVSGIAMAAREGIGLNGFNWLTASLILFGVTGAIWLAVLLPLQRAMIRHSKVGPDGQAGDAGLSPEYRRASRLWAIFGIAATLLPLVILYLMIAKSF
ncbi:DUF2269 family protein [Paenibacillus arenilitoris]|uniref:DUF2269 family protein n=1 Tax=Paenibacillus arenilitoris TaxID=2772299 RepID=A0A927H4Q0_9BACL|nr:DUF2269 family protein [Paenibacillus arenilitoris]MBD2867617.1 DUF2269 family protein [Paenibacillus arenilitoris]